MVRTPHRSTVAALTLLCCCFPSFALGVIWDEENGRCDAYLDLSNAAGQDSLAYLRTGNQIGACAAAQTDLHYTLIARNVCRNASILDQTIAEVQEWIQHDCVEWPRLIACQQSVATLHHEDAVTAEQPRATWCQRTRNAQHLLDAIVKVCPEEGMNPHGYDGALSEYCAAPPPAKTTKHSRPTPHRTP